MPGSPGQGFWKRTPTPRRLEPVALFGSFHIVHSGRTGIATPPRARSSRSRSRGEGARSCAVVRPLGGAPERHDGMEARRTERAQKTIRAAPVVLCPARAMRCQSSVRARRRARAGRARRRFTEGPGPNSARRRPRYRTQRPSPPPPSPRGGRRRRRARTRRQATRRPLTTDTRPPPGEKGVSEDLYRSFSRASAIAGRVEHSHDDAVAADEQEATEAARVAAPRNTGAYTVAPVSAAISTGGIDSASGSMSHERRATAGMRKTATCAADASAISPASAILPR